MTKHNQERLDSEEIDSRYPYSSQLEIVKACLREAFWEYSNQIRITNSFFLDLDFFMWELKNFQNFMWDKKSEKYQELLDNVVSWGNAIKWTIVHYWMDADDKMEADLRKQWKSDDQLNVILKARYDKFLSLLRERIVYEEHK